MLLLQIFLLKSIWLYKLVLSHIVSNQVDELHKLLYPILLMLVIVTIIFYVILQNMRLLPKCLLFLSLKHEKENTENNILLP